MNYISRNFNFDINDNKAVEIYSDSTCEHLEYTCNYNDMIEILNDNIRVMLEDGLINNKEALNMRNNYIMYNEYVELFEHYGAAIKSQGK